MGKLLLGFPNKIDVATLSGGSWETALPLINLQTTTLRDVARTVDTALTSTTFDITFAHTEGPRCLGLFNHNLSLQATVRWIASNLADFSVLRYDSGELDAWPIVYPPSMLRWEDQNWWDGRYNTTQREGYTPAHIIPMATEVFAIYWRCIISDVSNAAGHIDIGRVFIGPAHQPIINMSYGAAIMWEPNTKVQVYRQGAEEFDVRRACRVKTFALNNMLEDEALGWAFELQRQAGIHGEVVYIEDPDDTWQAIRTRFLGRLRKLAPIENPMFGRHNTVFEIKERL